MKITNFKLVSSIVLLFCVQARAQSGTETGNGGDVFDTGSAIEVWDSMEYGKIYSPSGTVEQRIIESHLDVLAAKLPNTAVYLRTMFYEKGLLYWLVSPQLKDASNGRGETNLILSYRRIQAAINNGGLVQINEGVWNQLNDLSRAFLLLHEVLWTATNYEATSAGSIRALAGILMSDAIASLDKETLASQMKRFARGALLVSIVSDTTESPPPPQFVACSLYIRYDGNDRAEVILRGTPDHGLTNQRMDEFTYYQNYGDDLVGRLVKEIVKNYQGLQAQHTCPNVALDPLSIKRQVISIASKIWRKCVGRTRVGDYCLDEHPIEPN